MMTSCRRALLGVIAVSTVARCESPGARADASPNGGGELVEIPRIGEAEAPSLIADLAALARLGPIDSSPHAARAHALLREWLEPT
jgi:hypothetical protein